MRTADPARRVVVTGVGMVSPLANGVRLSWERLLAGNSGIAPIEGFDPSDLPVKIAGEIPSGDDEGAFRPADIVSTKDLRKMDDFIVYALCAAVEAVEDSGWTPDDEESLERTGVMIGSGIGGLKTIEAATVMVNDKGRGGSARFSSRRASSTWPRATCRSDTAFADPIIRW